MLLSLSFGGRLVNDANRENLFSAADTILFYLGFGYVEIGESVMLFSLLLFARFCYLYFSINQCVVSSLDSVCM